MKTKEEFVLSEKIYDKGCDTIHGYIQDKNWLGVRDVKEFVKIVKEMVDVLNDKECQITPNQVLEKINEVAGEKLI